MSIADELQRLQELHDSGALTDQEFETAKAQVLAGDAEPGLGESPSVTSSIAGWMSEREWCMILHLALFAGYVVPVLGWVLPILIWQLLKKDYPILDEHGRNMANWLISKLFYAVLSALLVFALIGIPMLIALGICSVVFPIIAAIKANEGEVWAYPISIRFF